MPRYRHGFNAVTPLALVLAAAIAPIARGQVSFRGLGNLGNGTTGWPSIAHGVSGDGSTAVGYSDSYYPPPGYWGVDAFRWTRATGMQSLGDLPGGGPANSAHAHATSHDGSVIVGRGTNASGTSEAFRWTSTGGMVGLGFPSHAYGVSADGSIIVGVGPGGYAGEAFRWTSTGGRIGLGFLSGDNSSDAYAISANGSAIVGNSSKWVYDDTIGASSVERQEAFRWTAASGMQGLGFLSPSLGCCQASRASAVSADASIIVGSAVIFDDFSSFNQAFRWTDSGGMQGLGHPLGVDTSLAAAVSGDGSIIVGGTFGYNSTGQYQPRAFIWDAVHGMRILRDVLINDYGLDLTGWRLDSATGISVDGQTIVGIGANPSGFAEGWIVTLPASSPLLPGDFNRDGTVDAADYVVWRKNDGTQPGYDTWRAHFGQTVDGGATSQSLNTAVPEPAMLVLLLVALSLIRQNLQRTRRSLSRTSCAKPAVDRHANKLLVALLACLAGSSSAQAINISVDYSYDLLANGGSGIFETTPAAVAAVNAAAADISAAIGPSLSAVPTEVFTGAHGGATTTLDAYQGFYNPSTGAEVVIESVSPVSADAFTVYAGMRRHPFGEYATGGNVGVAFRQSFTGPTEDRYDATTVAMNAADAVMSREGGGDSGPINNRPFVLGFQLASMGPLAGVMQFNNDTDNDGLTDSPDQLDAFWHYDHTAPVSAGQIDFYTTALHEIIHAMGFGLLYAKQTWDDMRTNGTWNGAHARALNGGSGENLLAGSQDHIRVGFMSTRITDGAPQLAVMTPNAPRGERLHLTAIDLAFLQDVGYALAAEPSDGDFNHDGTVDAADYVVWRKGLGTTYKPDDYNMWRAHFGQTAGSSATAGLSSSVVPEPSGLALVATGLVAMVLSGRRCNRNTRRMFQRGCHRPGKTVMNTKRIGIVALSIVAFAPATDSTAALRSWNAGNGNWNTPGNWLPIGVPGAGDDVYILFSDGISRDVTYDYSGPPVALNSLWVNLNGATGGPKTYLLMSGNYLTVGELDIGWSGFGGSHGFGSFSQSGGVTTVTGPGVYIGVNTTDGGEYSLRGSATLSVATSLVVGGSGAGWLFLSDHATVTANDLFIGGAAGSGFGEVRIFDQSTLYVSKLSISDPSKVLVDGGTLRFSLFGSYGSPDRIEFIHGTIQLGGSTIITSDSSHWIPKIFDGFTVRTSQSLVIEGSATLLHPFTIDGGAFSAGQLVNAHLLDLRRGTLNITNQAVTIGPGGVLGSALDVKENTTVNVALGITNQGLVTGDGQLGGTFTNAAGGELRAEPGRSLMLTGAHNANVGLISLYGGMFEFMQNLTNSAGGFISGNGTIKTAALTNNGTINFSGLANVVGDVSNLAAGKIISSGGGPITFHDDVANQGEIRTSAGSYTVFFGAATGTGSYTGLGTVNFEGDLKPGNSPASIAFAGDVVFGPESNLEIELGGNTAGAGYDQLNVAGKLTPGGTLDVSLTNGFTPSAGQAFNILDWGSLVGTFSILNLPSLTGLVWNTSQLYSTGVLSVTTAGLPGDYNQNGTVDAADYVVWRKNLGSATSLPNDDTPGAGPDDYNRWRGNFGRTARSGAAANAVPEPTSAMVLLFTALSGFARRRAYLRVSQLIRA